MHQEEPLKRLQEHPRATSIDLFEEGNIPSNLLFLKIAKLCGSARYRMIKERPVSAQRCPGERELTSSLPAVKSDPTDDERAVFFSVTVHFPRVNLETTL